MLSNFLARHGAVLGSFGLIQAMQILLPLLALPWLARVLGPDAFGLLMYLCLIPPLVALFVDWGLMQGGGREAAWGRGQAASLAALLGAALSAKIILCALCLLLCLLLWPFLPHARAYPLAYFLAVLAGIARGLNPAWFFQGAGFGMPKVAALDAGASAIALGLVFSFIHEPQSWPLYLLFLAACKGAAYGWLIAGLWRRFKPRLGMRQGLALIRRTATFSGTACSQMLCYNGGQLALGYFLSAPDMGMIAAINKMLRSLVSLVNPFTQTLFPELCILRVHQPGAARRVLRWSLGLTASAAILCSALVWLLAPWLIQLALGEGYCKAAGLLRIAITAAPLMAINNVLASQALVPFGLEKMQLLVQASCAFLGLPLAGLLAAALGADGGACLPACLEALMLAGFAFILATRCPALFAARQMSFDKRLH